DLDGLQGRGHEEGEAEAGQLTQIKVKSKQDVENELDKLSKEYHRK
ncbi:MAG: hypothetical protein IH583_03900, partial [Candidatus Aminicenantes bacterium]|nr:hypothetical protein [Candidatus Aminicenantes bacterium]